MVSAVFHSPRAASVEAKAAAPLKSVVPTAPKRAAPAVSKQPFDTREFWLKVLPPIAGAAGFGTAGAALFSVAAALTSADAALGE